MAEAVNSDLNSKLDGMQQSDNSFAFVLNDSGDQNDVTQFQSSDGNVQTDIPTQYQTSDAEISPQFQSEYNQVGANFDLSHGSENAEMVDKNIHLKMEQKDSVVHLSNNSILTRADLQVHAAEMISSSGNQIQSSMGQNTEQSVPPVIHVTTVADSGVQSQEQVYSDDPSVPSSPCLICSDRGSGFHYSVFSCEGCKGFFKRSVQKNLVYTCKNEGDCVINKFTRNNCQYCRFVKCTQMGMKREAVREDRSPGGKHRIKKPRLDEIRAMIGSDGEVVFVPNASESKLAADSYEDAMTEGLIAARPDLIPRADGNIGLQSMGINQLMQYGYAELKYIIDWAKKVPGFTELCLEDQMALLKSSFMELNVLRLSFRSMESDNNIKFAEGLKVPIELAQKMGWGKELVAATVEFSSRLRELGIDKTEFCILNGIVLTYPDAQNLVEKPKVIILQTKILDSLRKYQNHKYPDNPKRFGKMLLRLPFLRTVSAKAAERFLSLTLDGTLQLNELVLEMIN